MPGCENLREKLITDRCPVHELLPAVDTADTMYEDGTQQNSNENETKPSGKLAAATAKKIGDFNGICSQSCMSSVLTIFCLFVVKSDMDKQVEDSSNEQEEEDNQFCLDTNGDEDSNSNMMEGKLLLDTKPKIE